MHTVGRRAEQCAHTSMATPVNPTARRTERVPWKRDYRRLIIRDPGAGRIGSVNNWGKSIVKEIHPFEGQLREDITFQFWAFSNQCWCINKDKN